MDIRIAIIEQAKKHLGKKYSVMDCSKYCQETYKPLGFVLPRTAAEQARDMHNRGLLKTFPASTKVVDIIPMLNPGDLVFWQQTDTKKGAPYCGNSRCSGACKRWNRIHHVGIYGGNGKLYESITSQNGVVYRDLWESASWQIIMAADVTSLLTGGSTVQTGGGEIMLKRGDKGQAVYDFQHACIKAGYSVLKPGERWPDMVTGVNNGADGSYGPFMRQLVESIQVKHKLPKTGEVDAATYGRVASEIRGTDTSALTAQLNAANAKIASAKAALA